MLHNLKGSQSTYKSRTNKKRKTFIIRLAATLYVTSTLLIGSAFAYSWYSNRQAPEPIVSTEMKPAKKVAASTVDVPKNAPVGVSLQQFSSVVKPGQNASIAVRTLKTAACTVKVTYDTKQSTDAGLIPKTADEYGSVTWAWTVEPYRPKGKWPVEVTCAHGSKSGYLRADLIIE